MDNKMISLGGLWRIIKDEENCGTEKGFHNTFPTEDYKQIEIFDQIPNSKSWMFDAPYANVFPKYHGFVWYYRRIDEHPAVEAGERVLIEFERAAYMCRAYLNGVFIGEHAQYEHSFYFDATDAYDPSGVNLLAVQCFEPRSTGEPIEGIELWKLPNACFAQIQGFMFGADDGTCLECVGGILGSVRLRAVPEVRAEEVYVRPFWQSGDVDITVTVMNSGGACKKEISALISAKKGGREVAELRGEFDIPAGKSEVKLSGKIENHQLWELDTPFLYTAAVGIGGKAHLTTNFGFKDFRVKDGFFFLNGKRIILKGAHASPVAGYAISMKALGFNAIRTITREFPEELFNICDEIGLLVLDAGATGWGMFLHEDSRRQIEEYNENIIRKHRSHPCLGAYYLVNELENNPELFSLYVQALPKLRALAPDAMFMLHSGRWDRDITLGSISNPGSDKWDTYLGAEGMVDYPNREHPRYMDGYQDPAMGDIHIYVPVPIEPWFRDYLRKIGHDTAPVYLSEFGIGSQLDEMGRYLENSDKSIYNVQPVEEMKRLWDEVEEFIDFYGLRNVCPSAFDFSRATDKLNGIQRTHLYNIFRGNPKINGISFTSFGVSHEGALQGDMVIKDSLAYSIQQGHAPLRWSLFSDERTVYAGKSFTVSAVLCNEDVLKPGQYDAQAYIMGESGCVWKKDFKIDYPKNGYGNLPPLAHPVLKESVCLPEGEYVFSARLLSGGVAYDGDLKITVHDAAERVSARVAVHGVSDNVCKFLEACGAEVIRLEKGTDAKLVLCGNVEDEELVKEFAAAGGTAVFIEAEYFKENEGLLKAIAGDQAYVRRSVGSIYHHDYLNVPHPVFDGINRAGLIESDRISILCPRVIFSHVKKPDSSICAGIRVDTSYTTPGLAFGEYALGKGKCVLNSFRIEQALCVHPYADRMLINIVKTYA